MRKGGTDMDSFQLSMIQKAIHRTYDELGKEVDSQGAIVDEIQKHKKNICQLFHMKQRLINGI